MTKSITSKPLLIVLYGFPGSGKSTFARQMSQNLNMAYVQADRIRSELFENPKYDKSEDQIVEHLTEYMMEEFLSAGVGVIYDADTIRLSKRKLLREFAKRAHAEYILAWFQIDTESAFARLRRRDRRKIDDKFAREFDRTTFDSYIAGMQNPRSGEDYLVLSGKHSFAMQRSTIMKRLYEMNLISADNATSNVIKPGLINIVPGRVDMSRRNIRIR